MGHCRSQRYQAIQNNIYGMLIGWVNPPPPFFSAGVPTATSLHVYLFESHNYIVYGLEFELVYTTYAQFTQENILHRGYNWH